jgi:gluconolactonase
MQQRLVAEGLRFPEGPVPLDDGSVLLVEMEAARLTHVAASGATRTIAQLRGGPNGAAIGPDGRCYICNNGGSRWHRRDGKLIPGLAADDYAGGWIEAVDLASGESEILYTECNGIRLAGPNDIVFDRYGGFYFTDSGRVHRRTRDRGAVYYADPAGGSIREIIFPMEMPNGVGLSPDGSILYVAETTTARLWAFDVTGPGEISSQRRGTFGEPGRLVLGLGGLNYFDSLAVDRSGRIHVATIPRRILVVEESGRIAETIELDDPFTTNVAFGGDSLTTAFATLSSTGRLIAYECAVPGLPGMNSNQRIMGSGNVE